MLQVYQSRHPLMIADTTLTPRTDLDGQDSASTPGSGWAPATKLVRRVAYPTVSGESESNCACHVHGRDVLHADDLLDERYNHLELAALTCVTCVGDGNRLSIVFILSIIHRGHDRVKMKWRKEMEEDKIKHCRFRACATDLDCVLISCHNERLHNITSSQAE